MAKWGGETPGPIRWFTAPTVGAVLGAIVEKVLLVPKLPKELLPFEPAIFVGSMFVFGLCFLLGAYYINKTERW